MSTRILIVDDDSQATETLARLLTARDFTVEQVNDPKRTLNTARLFRPDVVILDFLMPAMHGGEVAWQIAGDAELERTPAVVMLSGVPASQFEIKLPPIRVTLLEKPVDLEHLVDLLREYEPAGEASVAARSGR